MVLIYDSKYFKHLGMLQMHWLGSYLVADITDSRTVQLVQLYGILRPGWVNGALLKPLTPVFQ